VVQADVVLRVIVIRREPRGLLQQREALHSVAQVIDDQRLAVDGHDRVRRALERAIEAGERLVVAHEVGEHHAVVGEQGCVVRPQAQRGAQLAFGLLQAVLLAQGERELLHRLGRAGVDLERAPEATHGRIHASPRFMDHAEREMARYGLVVELERALRRALGLLEPPGIAQQLAQAHLRGEMSPVQLERSPKGRFGLLRPVLALADVAEGRVQAGILRRVLQRLAQHPLGGSRVVLLQVQLSQLGERTRLGPEATGLLISSDRLV
jgi:hypothetical protein